MGHPDEARAFWCYECLIPFPESALLELHASMAHSMCSGKPSGEVMANGRGRAPIACQQCSKAKAGCDKKLPCGRCKAKRFPCQPRFARRTTKDASQQSYRQSRRRPSVTFLLGASPRAPVDGHSFEGDECSPESSSYPSRVEPKAMASLQSMWPPTGAGQASLSLTPPHLQPASPCPPCRNVFSGCDGGGEHSASYQEAWTAGILRDNDGTVLESVSWLPNSTGVPLSPALSPTEREHPGFPGFGISLVPESSRLPMFGPSLYATTTALLAAPDILMGGWPLTPFTKEQQDHRLQGSARDYIGWLCHKLSQPYAWEELDNHVANESGEYMYSPNNMESFAMAPLGTTLRHSLQVLFSETRKQSFTNVFALSTLKSSLSLPSERSLLHIATAGLRALGYHANVPTHDLSSENGRSQVWTPPILLLLLAQGLLLMDHREAHLFAIGILACEKELAFGNLVTGNDPERARQSLFQAVAAWSGCGWLMSTAILQSRIRSSCGQPCRDENQEKADRHVCRDGFHMSVLFDDPPQTLRQPVLSVSQIPVAEAIQRSTCAGEAVNIVRSWFEEAYHELPDIGKESTLKDVSQSSLHSVLEEIHRRSYYVLKAVDVTCARGSTCTDYGCPRSQSLSRVHHVLGRWHDSFRGAMATSPLRIEGQEMLILYSLIWLATLVDVARLEQTMLQQIEPGTEGTKSTDSVQSKRDLVLKQVHCGQIFRIIQSLVQYAPRWWPLAIYRVTLILWTASLTPCQVDKSATIDPSLILSSDFGPIAWADTVAINEYPLDHERTQALIGLKDDLIPVLIAEDGTEIFMSHPEHILGYGVAFVKRGPPSLLRDGVLARLEALQESCYRGEEMAKESTPRSMN